VVAASLESALRDGDRRASRTPMTAEHEPLASPHPRRPGGLAVVGVALLAVLAVAAWVQWRQLALSQQALRSADGHTALAVYQVEVEYLRLWQGWNAAVGGDGSAAADLPRRYGSFVGRIDPARAPSLRELFADDPAYASTLALLDGFVERADPLLGRGGAPDAAALRTLGPPLQALAEPVHDLTLAAAHRVAERAELSNRALQTGSRLGVGLSLSLALLCAVFALLAMRQTRRLQERQATLETLTERLAAARREAESANEAKTATLADISHEIRTPFQGLLGMLSLLSQQRSTLSSRQAEQVQVALASGQHLLRILDDLLDLSQLQARRLTLHPVPLDLPQLLDEVQALMRTQAGAKGLLLQVDAEPDVPRRIVADGTRLRQVLYNLLSNAVKFCDRGSVVLDVRLKPGATPRLHFIVTDTGVGIGREAAERLFERFETAPAPHPAGSDRPRSVGLGLDISRRLARLMGGDITLHSVPGEGSRFCFELPLVPAPPAQAPAPAWPAAARGTGAPGRSLNVLVAEDHPVNRQYLASLFETLHHRCHFVGNGRDALDAVRTQTFDLVLMDLHMPEMDGLTATRAIRALHDPAAATVPIVALTADAFQETRERCLVAGMNDFLTKPVSPQDLVFALRRLFGEEAVADDARPPSDRPPASASLATDVALLDRTAVDRLLAGLPAAKVGELVGAYLDQADDTAQRMHAAVRDGLPLELRSLAHAARGAALNLGLAALAQTAQLLHEGAAHLPAHEVAHLVQRFEKLVPRTRAAAQEAGLPV
jgi:signal transduction histidine kinase/DNA-binding NarL/FixJ family response regulator/HPt (histidine-containing phosphotransfer) domain-containing protein